MRDSASWQAGAALHAISRIPPAAARRAAEELRRLYWLITGQAQRRLQEKRTYGFLRRSPLFDANYYAARYPDVASSGVEPLMHFIEQGAAAGRDPHPLFSTVFYREHYPEAAALKANPLEHFIRHGAREGHDPHPLFSTRFYFERDASVQLHGVNPLEHFLACGAYEGRDPHPLFSTRFYFERNPTVAETGVNPLIHYLMVGAAQGCDPNPDFSTSFYASREPDIAMLRMNPLVHYVLLGAGRGAATNPCALNSVRRMVSAAIREFEAERDHAALAGKIRFAETSRPEVSVVIPAYNQLGYTLRCLAALGPALENVRAEVIVVDDGSTDATPRLLAPIPGLRFLRSERNQGFLRACNMAARHARGDYLHLLNNDTLPLPGSVQALRETFSLFPRAGLVGSMLIYPSGLLQEAGGIVWEDGSAWNYGRHKEAERPEFGYVRAADYCSGASIMLPRALWEELGGFDERFAPAYYEDTDLAFRVRQAGRDVLYQPHSRVVHFEGITSGTDLTSGVKSRQTVNRRAFQKKWASALESHGQPGGADHFIRDRRARRHALVVDACTPTPDQDSGSNDTLAYLLALKARGFHVSFIPAHNLCHFGEHTNRLQKLGIECLYAPYTTSMEDYLAAEGHRFDLVVLFRVTVAGSLMDVVREHAARARVVFNTVDLHFLREQRQAEQTDSPELLDQARVRRDQELALMRRSDRTIVLSEYERDLLRQEDAGIRAVCIPTGRKTVSRVAGWRDRRDIAFVGGFRHTPNVDAVRFFCQSVWPRIRHQLPDCRFLVVGSHAPEEIAALASDGVTVVGFVKDLNSVLGRCRLTVAPLRFGAGIKGKIVSSLCHGVPCVATSIAVEGMGLVDGRHALVADDPCSIADSVVRLYNSRRLWEEMSEAGLALARERFSAESVRSRIDALLDELEIETELRPGDLLKSAAQTCAQGG